MYSASIRFITVLSGGLLLGAAGMQADDAEGAAIAKLIQQLGDAEFATRQRAQQRLIDVGETALPQLRAVADSEDAEVAFRARLAIREITALAPERRARLRASGQAAFHTGDHAEMVRSYQRLTLSEIASIDDHCWHGHAQQLLGNWKAAAESYVAALDRIDLILTGEIGQEASPADFETPKRREDFVRQRLGLIIVASRLQRELADDPQAAESILKRIYQHHDLLNESLDVLEARWRTDIVEALRDGKTISEFRRERRRRADLYVPMMALRELAFTQQRLKRPEEALESWRRIHLLTRVYLGHANGVDANAVGQLIQMLPSDAKPEPPAAFVISPEEPTLVMDLADAEVLKHAYSNSQNYWTFALSPPPGKEFATLKCSCDIEQFELRYAGQFDCWTEIGGHDPRRKGLGSIGWPRDKEPGRSVPSAKFDIEPGSGVVHVKTGSWAGKFKTHRVTVQATFRDRVKDEATRPQPIPGFRIQNECLPKGGSLTQNGEPYRTEVASHNVVPGKHVYEYSHPQRKGTQKQTIDAQPGKYYGLFFNLDSPFSSQSTNLSGLDSHFGSSSSFVQMSDGRWLAVWVHDSLHFATSRDLVHWSTPWQSDEAALYGGHYNCVLPSLYVDRDGTVWLAYFSNRLDVDRINSGAYRLYVINSKDGKKWSPPRAISLQISGWPPGVVQMLDGPEGKVWMIYRLQYAAADRVDNITSLAKLDVSASEAMVSHARNPHAVLDKAGQLHVVWDHFGQTLYYTRRDGDGRWTQPVEIWDQKLGTGVSHPLLFIDGDRLALICSRQGAYLRRGRYVDGTPVFDPPVKITHHVSPLVSAQPRRLDDGRLAILCGADTIWLRTVQPERLFHSKVKTLEEH